MVFGFDLSIAETMLREPRPFTQPVIVRSMMIVLFLTGLFMAAATRVLVEIGKTTLGSLQLGQTMSVLSLGLTNIFVALNLLLRGRAPSVP
jgi:Ca2+-transporting ATPase